jgi:hypothetical protein
MPVRARPVTIAIGRPPNQMRPTPATIARVEAEKLQAERARRWWQTRRPVGSITRAAAFVGDVGFALLFPKSGLGLPSLWEAASDRPIGESAEEWGPEIQRVWRWKDELPLRRLAWYGRFLRGRPSFLSPELLADLYPRSGRPDDFQYAPLGDDAGRVASVLLRSGPLPTAVLRQAANLGGKQRASRFDAALTELGRALVVTHLGTEQENSGWPSAVLELTSRVFKVTRRRNPELARRRAASAFLRTMAEARPVDLALAFGWPSAEAKSVLADLAAAGLATKEGRTYRSVEAIRSGRHAGTIHA